MLTHRRSFRSFSSRALLVALAAAAAACGVATEGSPEATGHQGEGLMVDRTGGAPDTTGTRDDGVGIGRPPWNRTPTLQGTVSVLYGVSEGAPTQTHYILTDATGARHSLAIEDTVLRRVALGRRIDGANVQVSGPLDSSGGMRVQTGYITQAAPAVSTQHRAFATYLCRFAGSAHPAQEDPQYFNDLFGSSYPGVAHYFATASYGALDMSGGATSAGWYDLPRSLADYQALATAPQPEDPIAAIVTDCANAVAYDLSLDDYQGVNIVLSDNVSAESFGGRWKFDDAHVNYPVTILSPLAFRSQRATVMAVGAALGMSRSSLTEVRKLDSQWDLMSAGGTCAVVDPTLGCVAVQPIADTRDALEWLSADDRAENAVGLSSIRLSPLGAPHRPGTQKLARFDFGDGSYVTAEVRTKAANAYEQNLPFEGVLLHHVAGVNDEVPSGSYRANVIDATPGDGDPQNAVLVHAGDKYIPEGGALGVMLEAVNGDEYTISLFQAGVLNVSNHFDTNATGTVTGPQISCGATCRAVFAPGTRVTLTATPGQGSYLRSFTGCDSWVGNTCTIYDMTKPHGIYADFGFDTVTDPNACYRDCLADVCDGDPKTNGCGTSCRNKCKK